MLIIAHNRAIFTIFFNMVCCVFSVESPHGGDSNEYTQHTIISINYPIYNNVSSYGFFFFVRDSRKNLK